jgi:hypothetical protein
LAIKSGNSAKRNSGRTGTRRLTVAEAAARGTQSLSDYQRRYGKPQSLPPLGLDAPSWFTPELTEIWHEIVSSAASGAFAEIDRPCLVGYVVAILTHRRLAMQIATADDPIALENRLRVAATEVRSAARALGLRPADRGKIEPASPVRSTADAAPNEFLNFDVVNPDGTRTPYTPAAGKRAKT